MTGYDSCSEPSAQPEKLTLREEKNFMSYRLIQYLRNSFTCLRQGSRLSVNDECPAIHRKAMDIVMKCFDFDPCKQAFSFHSQGQKFPYFF